MCAPNPSLRPRQPVQKPFLPDALRRDVDASAPRFPAPPLPCFSTSIFFVLGGKRRTVHRTAARIPNILLLYSSRLASTPRLRTRLHGAAAVVAFGPATAEFVTPVPTASLDMSCGVFASPATVNFLLMLLMGRGGRGVRRPTPASAPSPAAETPLAVTMKAAGIVESRETEEALSARLAHHKAILDGREEEEAVERLAPVNLAECTAKAQSTARLLREAEEDLARADRKACQGGRLKAMQDPSAQELTLPLKLVPPPYFGHKDPCHNRRGLRVTMGVQSDPQAPPGDLSLPTASNEVQAPLRCWPVGRDKPPAWFVGPTEHP